MADLVLLKPVVKEKPPADDIVRMLREMADRIEADEYGHASGGVFVLSTEESILLFGWGEDCQNDRDTVYYLEAAKALLL